MTFQIKSLFWRIIVEDDSFTYRNIWGKQRLYSFSDIISISVKPRYYLIKLADFDIKVDRRTTADCLRFLDEAAHHNVEIDENE